MDIQAEAREMYEDLFEDDEDEEDYEYFEDDEYDDDEEYFEDDILDAIINPDGTISLMDEQSELDFPLQGVDNESYRRKRKRVRRYPRGRVSGRSKKRKLKKWVKWGAIILGIGVVVIVLWKKGIFGKILKKNNTM
jgi:hypothetical protein